MGGDRKTFGSCADSQTQDGPVQSVAQNEQKIGTHNRAAKCVGEPMRFTLPDGTFAEYPFGYDINHTPRGVSDNSFHSFFFSLLCLDFQSDPSARALQPHTRIRRTCSSHRFDHSIARSLQLVRFAAFASCGNSICATQQNTYFLVCREISSDCSMAEAHTLAENRMVDTAISKEKSPWLCS